MRLLVVCGARALCETPAATRWAKREIARALSGYRVGENGLVASHVDLVGHGAARGPDTWADEIASWLGLPRVQLPCWGHVTRPLVCVGAKTRPVREWERYVYEPRDPHGRNARLMEWARDQRDAGHVVAVLALHAPWATTGGTAHAVRCARSHGLDVVEYTAPRETAPPSHGEAPSAPVDDRGRGDGPP